VSALFIQNLSFIDRRSLPRITGHPCQSGFEKLEDGFKSAGQISARSV
jgi:hypothetical protein